MAIVALDRLNGWQRLWAVLSVVWLPGAAWIAASDFPTEEERPSFQRVYLENQDLKRRAAIALSGKSAEATKQSPEDKWRHAEEANRQIDDEVRSAQLGAMAKGLALWIVPVVALYLLGLAGMWIAKGFRTKG